MIISPSILSADFCNLGHEVNDIVQCGADWIHVDVMDGHFVPNISIGIPIVKSLSKNSNAFLDVHLMISQPERYVDAFLNAGADLICMHYESTTEDNLIQAIDKIKAAGKLAGIAIKPATPASVLIPLIDKIDLVLVMTVEPGFGGQSFMEDMMPKLRDAKQIIGNRKCYLEVDGGINAETVKTVVANGADTVVAGSYIFDYADRKDRIKSLRIN